jgi:hypothetical protein
MQVWIGEVRYRLAAGAVLALVVQPVHASCGDYLAMGAHSKATEAGNLQMPTDPARPTVPCTGPSCSGGVPSSPIAPVPSDRTLLEEWGDMVRLPGLQEVELGWWLKDASLLAPVGRIDSIYHPPRRISSVS